MSSYIFDIESDNLLNELTTIHCIVAKDIETGAVVRASSQNGMIVPMLRTLMEAHTLWGHNIVRFDIKAIQKLHSWFQPHGIIRDTQVCAQLIWPADLLKPIDASRAAKGKFPKHLMGRHSLEAWGHRIGEYKVPAKQDFSKWTQELEDYCVQDVEVTDVLRQRIVAKQYSEQAIQLEHDVAEIIFEQEQNGAPFDEAKAQKLYASLVQTRLDIERELVKTFGSFYLPNGITVPKRDNKKQGSFAGCAYQKLKLVEFNPGSRDHIANRLIHMRGWKPVEFTDDGKPKVDEAVVSKLKYPETKQLMRYLLVQKRIGQLAEGKEALLKHVRNGRIHGRVVGNGAITGRATHSKPNLGQVPKVKKSKEGVQRGEAGGWGFEFRDLFYAPDGWRLVGADASGLELRELGHYMARWDNGAYAKEVVEGDVHSITMNALANLGQPTRDTSKTWMYAWLYGAGDKKLGTILKKNMKAGSMSRDAVLGKLPALKYLVDAVKSKHRSQKYLVGLDKRILHTRSEHAALNTLLQGGGAVTCKVWLTILHLKLRERGWRNGVDYMQILWVHDEVQILARPEIADEVGTIAVEAVREAGRVLGLRCPLDGEYKVGRTWAETH